jgi:hypothetical protein
MSAISRWTSLLLFVLTATLLTSGCASTPTVEPDGASERSETTRLQKMCRGLRHPRDRSCAANQMDPPCPTPKMPPVPPPCREGRDCFLEQLVAAGFHRSMRRPVPPINDVTLDSAVVRLLQLSPTEEGLDLLGEIAAGEWDAEICARQNAMAMNHTALSVLHSHITNRGSYATRCSDTRRRLVGALVARLKGAAGEGRPVEYDASVGSCAVAFLKELDASVKSQEPSRSQPSRADEEKKDTPRKKAPVKRCREPVETAELGTPRYFGVQAGTLVERLEPEDALDPAEYASIHGPPKIVRRKRFGAGERHYRVVVASAGDPVSVLIAREDADGLCVLGGYAAAFGGNGTEIRSLQWADHGERGALLVEVVGTTRAYTTESGAYRSPQQNRWWVLFGVASSGLQVLAGEDDLRSNVAGHDANYKLSWSNAQILLEGKRSDGTAQTWRIDPSVDPPTMQLPSGPEKSPDSSAQPATGPPIELQPVHRVDDVARTRFALSNGDVVQMQSGCSEWKGGGSGFLVQLSHSTSAPRIVEFDAGSARELDSGYLLVESQRQVGNDASDDPLDLPDGAEAHYRTSTGTLYVSRVIGMDLDTGRTLEAAWDTFAPATAGDERVVVFAQTESEAFMVDRREASSYWTWDLAGDRKRKLAETSGRPQFRVAGSNVLVRVVDGEKTTYVSVDGSTGERSTVTPGQWEAASPTSWPAKDRLEREFDGEWIDQSGRPIVVEAESGPEKTRAPRTGGCGLGPYWKAGFLFTDGGVFEWPESLELAD